MDPSELRGALMSLYGRRGFVYPATQDLGVSRSTIWRWLSGQSPIPKAIVLAVRGMLRNKR